MRPLRLFPVLLALSTVSALPALAEANLGRSRVAEGRGRSRTIVSGEGRALNVRLGRGKAKRMVNFEVGGKCSTEAVSSVVAKTVQRNAPAFRGAGRKGVRVRGAMRPGQLASFERAIGKILRTGKHRVAGKRGFTEIPGFRIAPAGRGRRGRNARDSGGGTFTINPSRGGGTSLVRELVGDNGVRDTTSVTFGADGSSTLTRMLAVGNVVVTETTEHDGEGNQTGGFTTVHAQGGLMYTGNIQPSSPEEKQESDQSSGNDDSQSPEPPSQEENDDTDENDTSPDMTSEDSFSVPPLKLDDAMLGQMINWNRLGSAVSYPNPTGDDDPTVDDRHAGKTMGPCGDLEAQGFVPDAKFLRPNKGGWVTDPVPALHGSQRGRGSKD